MAFDLSDERLSAMLRGRRHVREVPFPGLQDTHPDALIGVRVLLDSEVDACRENAAVYVKGRADRLKLNVAELLHIDPDLQHREQQRQVIATAFVKLPAEDGKHAPLFASPTQVAQLDATLVQALWYVYEDHQRFVSPVSELDQEQLDELVAAVKKSPQKADMYLAHYGAQTLSRLLRSMVALLPSAPTSK